MTETADVVVIGGGVVGASVACHLVEAGCRKVMVLEAAAHQGAGSTGRAMGGVRAQFATPLHIHLSLHSLDVLARFREEHGHEVGFRPYGYLLLAVAPERMERLRELQARQVAAGLTDVEMLDAAEIAARFPEVRTDDLSGGCFRQGDGFIDPLALTRGYTERALRGGARLRLGQPVTGLDVEGGRVRGVRTPDGRVHAPVVVNAAGPWAAEVARMAGVDLPVRPLRRQIAGTAPVPGLPEDFPMVIEMDDGFHFRRDPRVGPPSGVRMGMPDPAEQWGHDTALDPDFAAAALARARHRAPALAGAVAEPLRCSAGLYAMSPDHHAILGEAEEVGGLFFANGFSGHGVMHSPATGRILAELILTGRCDTFPEAAALSPRRFAQGHLLHEPAFL